MPRLLTSLLAWSAIAGIACGQAIDSASFAVERDVGDREAVNSISALRTEFASSSSTGTVPTKLGRSLYWFGNFSVGDSDDVRLLIDTGSTDLLLNQGVYKPSKAELPYNGKHIFRTGYEGVNRAGYGIETVNGTVHYDTVGSAGLKVPKQAMGNVTHWKYYDVRQLPYANPGKGIIGFEGRHSSAFKPGAPSWIYNLAHLKLIAEHRFGLAFGTSGKGEIHIGKFVKSQTKGRIVKLPRISSFDSYVINGDVTLDDQVFLENQKFIFDVGTDNIQGPIKGTREVFERLGYPSEIQKHGGDEKLLLAYFQCDKPPTLGFSFPATKDLKKGERAKNFNVSPKVWDVYQHKHDKTNCTSILGGTNLITRSKLENITWLIGQSFFAGHYVDFDIEHDTISIADLKDPSG